MDQEELRNQLERLHKKSYGWALHCCSSDRVMAEDVLQSAYLKVLEGKANFEGRSEFPTWLFAVIKRTALEFFRRKRLTFFLSISERGDGAMTETPETAIHQSNLEAILRAALETLSARQREILHLVFYQDLSLSQAAEVLGISLGSARTHYERGKQRIRQWLEKSYVAHEL